MVQSLAAAGCREACHYHDDNNSDQYMYRQAIHIHLKDIESTYQVRAMVSSMIIFNIALAHHLSALVSDEKRQSEKLHKATTLYKLAYNLQRGAQLENNFIFTMATINNLGVIYRQVEDKETATKCFQHLLVMFWFDCGAAKACCDEELDGFLRNATTNLVPELSCTAAAA